MRVEEGVAGGLKGQQSEVGSEAGLYEILSSGVLWLVKSLRKRVTSALAGVSYAAACRAQSIG